MPKPVNINDLDWGEFGQGERFGSQRKGLTDSNRGAGISCSLYRVAPGKAAFPKHAHLANDEAIFMLKGQGSLTIGDETFEVNQGDYVHLPKGESGAHIFVNTSDADMEYLCMSTSVAPEVVFYPDSNKTGVFDFGREGFMREMYDREPVDYWKGEAD